ncbi:MAG: flagellar FliL protein [Bradymonadia bacterium]|jgi:flagellar FliL protein
MADETFDEFSEEGGKKKPVLLIALGVLVLAGNGAFAFTMINKGDDAEGADTEVAVEVAAQLDVFDPMADPGPIVSLEPFVINLDEPERARYLRVALGIELADEAGVERTSSRMPRLRDRYISHLASQNASGLSSTEDKDRLREELLTIARETVAPAQARAIYFTEFIIQ